MSDVRFRNLEGVPFQEDFNSSTVFKISTASKIAALLIGIISICVFTLTDNAKTRMTTISSKEVDGSCTMLSAYSGTYPTIWTTVAADVAQSFYDGFFALLKDTTGTTKSTYLDESGYGLQSRTSAYKILEFSDGKSDAVSLFQVYFPSYQSCIDAFSKPPVCSYLQLKEGRLVRDHHDQPFKKYTRNGNVPLENVCESSLKCTWPEILHFDNWDYWKFVINVTSFNCAPSTNFTTCESISSLCTEYASFAKGFGELFHRIHPAEQMCRAFKSNPPYSCTSFEVVSPIQVISQTLSLMATALGGSELFLYVIMKYRNILKRSTQTKPEP
jgi:hypothetical protein